MLRGCSADAQDAVVGEVVGAVVFCVDLSSFVAVPSMDGGSSTMVSTAGALGLVLSGRSSP